MPTQSRDLSVSVKDTGMGLAVDYETTMKAFDGGSSGFQTGECGRNKTGKLNDLKREKRDDLLKHQLQNRKITHTWKLQLMTGTTVCD